MSNAKKINPINKLMQNTLIYFIGTFMSKAFQFLFIPIITAILMPEEYGYYDVVVTTASIVIPVITLQIIDGMFRYLYNSSEQYATKLISHVVYLLYISIGILAVFLFLINYYTSQVQYSMLIFFYYSLFTLNMLFQKIARSKGRNSIFAISGVLYTFALLIFQYFFLVVLEQRINGLLMANIIAYIISISYIIFKTAYHKYIKIIKIDRILIKEIIIYSIPLIPNTLSWWAIGSLNSYIVIAFLGIEYNGILAIASKFPNLLTMATSVFQLSWQEAAISESENKNNSIFYSNVFNNYCKIIFLLSIIVLFFSKVFINIMLGQEYSSSWLYIPPLLYAVVYSTLSSFLGAGYLASKKTRGAFTTTVIGASVNIVITLLFIRDFGLFAPTMGKFIGFMVLMFIRIYDMKEYFKMTVDWKQFILLNSISTLAIFLYYYIEGGWLYALIFISIIIFFILNKVVILKLMYKLLKRNSLYI